MLLSINSMERAWKVGVTPLFQVFCDDVSMRNAGLAAGRNDPHTVTAPKPCRITFLDDGYQLPGIHFDRDFHRLLPGNALFDCATGKATSDRTEDRGNGRAAAPPQRTAGDTPYRRASNCPDRRLGAFHQHRPNRFDNAHPDRLLTTRLITRINISRFTRCTSGQQRNENNYQSGRFHHLSHQSDAPKARW
jgi:hypothetical protein